MIDWKALLLDALDENGECLEDVVAATAAADYLNDLDIDEDPTVWTANYVYIGVNLPGSSPVIISAPLTPVDAKYW